MTLEQLEAEILAMPEASQVALVSRLLTHLGVGDQIDSEIGEAWVEEAELRDRAMDEHQVTGIPAQEVFQKLRAALQ
jgi:Putative addiction module component